MAVMTSHHMKRVHKQTIKLLSEGCRMVALKKPHKAKVWAVLLRIERQDSGSFITDDGATHFNSFSD